jgi:ABC-2 type transport system permease protein
MRAALTIARKEIAQRIRDRSFLIIGFAAPLILAFVFNLILGGLLRDGASPVFDFGLVVPDDDPVGEVFQTILTTLEAEGVVIVTTYDSAEAAQAAIDEGDLDAAFILPPELTNAMIVGQASITVVGNVDATTGTAVAEAIAAQFAHGAWTAQVGVQTAFAAGAITQAEIGEATDRAAAIVTDAMVTLEPTATASRQLSPATYFISGIGIFFIFFIVGLAVTSMLWERTNGTLGRLLAAPIRPASILAGKVLSAFTLGILAMTVLAIVGTVVLGADFGNPIAAAAVIFAAVFAAAGIMTFAGGLARTADQAGALQSIVALTLAMLGGTFVPITDESGSVLEFLRYLTPNAWYLRGLGDVSGGALAEAFTAAAILALIGLVFGTAGLLLVRRQLRP